MNIFKSGLFRAKKGVMNLLIIGVLVVAVFLFASGGLGGGDGLNIQLATAPSPDNGNGNGDAPVALCAKEDATVTLSGIDSFDSSIEILGTHRYRIDTKWQSLADSSSITTDPQETIQVAYGDGNKSAAGPFFWTFLDSTTLKCVGEKTLTGVGIRNGTLATRLFNSDDAQANSPANNNTIGAGGVETFAFDYESQFERAAGPNGICWVAEFNNTVYDDVIISFGGITSRTSTPDFYTLDNSEHRTKAYVGPATSSLGRISGSITVDADDAEDPLIGSFGAGSSIRITGYPEDFYLNTKDNSFELSKCQMDQDGNRLANRPAYIFDVIID